MQVHAATGLHLALTQALFDGAFDGAFGTEKAVFAAERSPSLLNGNLSNQACVAVATGAANPG
ncbi:hypothetical protein P153DRAFT_368871, partial [Dothidotthia symphoricarpi CBS 119687]